MGKERVSDAKIWVYYFFLHVTEDLAKNPEISGDSNAITVEVTLGNSKEMETYEVTSPSAVFILAGITHSIKPIRMTIGKCGGILAIVSNGEYSAFHRNNFFKGA